MSIGIIILVILIFGFLVFVHELGHFVAARRNGVEVDEFGFGFPPRLIGKKWGKTLYSINWLPLGGFVKLRGESLSDSGVGSFGAASFWAKTKILFAGVTMNALTAYLILAGLCLTGLPPVLQNQYSFGESSFNQPKQVMAAVVAPASPAEAAGIERGDLILKGNGRALTSEADLVDFTKENAGKSVAIEVSHDGEAKTLTPTLRSRDSKEGFLGVTPFQTFKLQYGFLDALVTAGGILGQLMWATLVAFGGLVSGLFTEGQVSENVAGPVGIVSLLGIMTDLGIPYLLLMVASLSVSLAVLNALPLPALDGGRWLMAAVQKVSRRSLSQTLENGIHLAGFAFFILLMVFVTYFDIQRLNQ